MIWGYDGDMNWGCSFTNGKLYCFSVFLREREGGGGGGGGGRGAWQLLILSVNIYYKALSH